MDTSMLRVFALETLNRLHNISVENLRENGGTLGLSLYDMLKVLNKHNIEGRFLVIEKRINTEEPFEEPIGYCLYYEYENNIQISHICLNKECQSHGLGKKFIDFLKDCYEPSCITADVSYDNWKSEKFFKKHGFTFEENDEKQRWRVTYTN